MITKVVVLSFIYKCCNDEELNHDIFITFFCGFNFFFMTWHKPDVSNTLILLFDKNVNIKKNKK